MRHAFRITLVVPAVLLVGAGCATKDFVKETSARQRAEVDQRIDKVEGQVSDAPTPSDGRKSAAPGSGLSGGDGRNLSRRSHRHGEGCPGERKQRDGPGRRSDDAGRRGGQPLSKLWNDRNARSLVETAEVRFGFGKADLNDGAQTSLLGLVKEMKENPRLTVELEGYTDSVGPVDYNVSLSQRRVDAVRRFLVQHGIEQTRIHAIGLGPLPDGSLPADQKRRVTVKLIALAD
jgi:outer membrane protein OmpA-like peptidoglycan-associated protein